MPRGPQLTARTLAAQRPRFRYVPVRDHSQCPDVSLERRAACREQVWCVFAHFTICMTVKQYLFLGVDMR